MLQPAVQLPQRDGLGHCVRLLRRGVVELVYTMLGPWDLVDDCTAGCAYNPFAAAQREGVTELVEATNRDEDIGDALLAPSTPPTLPSPHRRIRGSIGMAGASCSCCCSTTIVRLWGASADGDVVVVMTKPKERDGVTKYHVTRHPIPLELLTVTNFTDPPTQRGAGLLRFGKSGGGSLGGAHPADSPLPTPGSGPSPDVASDSRVVYPCTIHHTGCLGGLYVLYAESASARAEWKEKLAEAQGLRKVVQEANKVFQVETLSIDMFLVPSFVGAGTGANSPWNADGQVTGQVTCSMPFTTADGCALVAVGCAEGAWIGFRHDARSMRKVLSLKMVTQCAMLEEFGIFLVLADKSLEPVVDKINERAKQPVSFGSRLGFRQARSD